MIIRLGRGMCRRITMQRMHRAGIILLRRRGFLPDRALHPGRRTRGRVIVCRPAVHTDRARGPAAVPADWPGPCRRTDRSDRSAARVPPADRSRPWRTHAGHRRDLIVVGGKRSVLISISHRDDASPSGKPPTRPSYKRTGPCQMPSQVPTPVSSACPCLPHLVRSMDAENGEPGCQNRDDALDQCQPRLRDLCIIIDNEA